MKFVLPCKEYEQKAIEYIQEFYDYSSPINGVGGLDTYLKESTYSEWLVKIMKWFKDTILHYKSGCKKNTEGNYKMGMRYSIPRFLF